MRSISLCIALLLVTGAAFAVTIHVGPGLQYSTIQAGINAATTGDTVLVQDGNYTGASNKNLDFAGRQIVLISESGPENCIIDCQNSGRGFYFHSGETNASKVIGITVRGGSSTMGGGINCTSASPFFKNCVIASNQSAASYGGGIYISSGDPVFERCTIYGNTSQYGGAMYAMNSNFTLNTCIVAANTASG